MIACISPSSSDFDESLNTLNYATRARNIQNQATVNCKREPDRVEGLEQQIKALRRALENRQRSETRIISHADPNRRPRLGEGEISRLQAQSAHYRMCTDTAYRLKFIKSALFLMVGLPGQHLQVTIEKPLLICVRWNPVTRICLYNNWCSSFYFFKQ